MLVTYATEQQQQDTTHSDGNIDYGHTLWMQYDLNFAKVQM